MRVAFTEVQYGSMQTHRFYKNEFGSWYIDLPAYLEKGGSQGDLAMVAGADTMLDIAANGDQEVVLTMDTQPFGGADELVRTRICDPAVGGGDYFMQHFEGREVNQPMWLCGVTEFVFNDIPERIYVRRS